MLRLILIYASIALIWTNPVSAILNNQWNRQYEGIADDPAFGCRWLQAELNCNCQRVEKVSLI